MLRGREWDEQRIPHPSHELPYHGLAEPAAPCQYGNQMWISGCGRQRMTTLISASRKDAMNKSIRQKKQSCRSVERSKSLKKTKKCYLCKVDDPNAEHYDPRQHRICPIHAISLWELAKGRVAFDMRDSTVVMDLVASNDRHDAKKGGVFNDKEIRTLISAVKPGTLQKDIVKFLSWCTLTRVGQVILNSILEGTTIHRVRKHGDPSFIRDKTAREIKRDREYAERVGTSD